MGSGPPLSFRLLASLALDGPLPYRRTRQERDDVQLPGRAAATALARRDREDPHQASDPPSLVDAQVQQRLDRRVGGHTLLTMKFHTTLLQMGNNTGIEVPEEVLVALDRGRRVKVVATVNGYTYRTTVAPAYGKILMPFSAQHRAASGLSGGEAIEVELVPDDAPRDVEVPHDLAAALGAAPEAADYFAGLSYSHKRAYVEWIEGAKKPETRARRSAQAIEMLLERRTR